MLGLVLCLLLPGTAVTTPPKVMIPALVPPVAVGTWGFSEMAVRRAMEVLNVGGTAMDAVEQGINVVEQHTDNREQYYVGLGGYPNAEGVMELDAAIMDGKRRTYGAVAGLTGATRAISVARAVMEHSPHNVIVGAGAAKFAETHGLGGEEALTEAIRDEWQAWKAAQAQQPQQGRRKAPASTTQSVSSVEIAMGTSWQARRLLGWRFKHPGRVGDSPLVGSGLYADQEAGAAVATGDGEEIMRVCLSFLVVEKMREGMTPTQACRLGIARLKHLVAGTDGGQARWHEKLTVAVVAIDKHGVVGAASTLGPSNVHRDRPAFPFVVWRGAEERPHTEEAADVEVGADEGDNNASGGSADSS